MRLTPGTLAPDFSATDIHGTTHTIREYRGTPLMLSFFRYAACPLCNLRVSRLRRNHDQYESMGLVTLGIFNSTQENITRFVGTQPPPFPTIPDITKTYYDLYGVEEDPLIKDKMEFLRPYFDEAGRAGYTGENIVIDGSVYTLPADFLINPDGTIHTAHYGAHIADHVPMTQIDDFLKQLV